MTQQILFIGGPLDREFDEVPTPLPPSLPYHRDGAPPIDYRLYYIVERHARSERRWPVYVHGPLPLPGEVLNLWYVRATIWEVLPGAQPASVGPPRLH